MIEVSSIRIFTGGTFRFPSLFKSSLIKGKGRQTPYSGTFYTLPYINLWKGVPLYKKLFYHYRIIPIFSLEWKIAVFNHVLQKVTNELVFLLSISIEFTPVNAN